MESSRFAEAEAVNFVNEAYKHCKTVAASGSGVELLKSAGVIIGENDNAKSEFAVHSGVLVSRDGEVGDLSAGFIKAIAQHRHWQREASL